MLEVKIPGSRLVFETRLVFELKHPSKCPIKSIWTYLSVSTEKWRGAQELSPGANRLTAVKILAHYKKRNCLRENSLCCTLQCSRGVHTGTCCRTSSNHRHFLPLKLRCVLTLSLTEETCCMPRRIWKLGFLGLPVQTVPCLTAGQVTWEQQDHAGLSDDPCSISCTSAYFFLVNLT